MGGQCIVKCVLSLLCYVVYTGVEFMCSTFCVFSFKFCSTILAMKVRSVLVIVEEVV